MPESQSVAIHQFPCLSDNFGVLLHDLVTKTTIAIDVPDAAPYLSELQAAGWTLTHILITHHHWDHVDGLQDLKAATGAVVYGPKLSKDKIKGLDHLVDDGDELEIGPWTIECIGTPGHTLDQISFFFPQLNVAHTGDTMFAMGCGRVFEGDLPMMWASLDKLAKRLPSDTEVYCGHEYTQSNARFALTVDPNNEALKTRAADVERLRSEGRPTLPTTMAQELATNPFLRAADPAIQTHLGMEGQSPAAVFAEIRTRKDKG
ncbi:MAG: hydroxyacylglutathione hydrolase [Rhodobacteraceae bacterium]|nr:hydroxyacylglutathione hydrolase [Paracoccaceae bacterium]